LNKPIVILIAWVTLWSLPIVAQQDTSHVGLTVAYSDETLPLSKVTTEVYSVHLGVKGERNTWVSSLMAKQINGKTGHLFGTGFYRRWNRGYGHASLYYGTEGFYSQFSGQVDMHFNTWEGLVLDLGCSYYIDENSTFAPRLGVTFYFQNMMANYTMNWSSDFPISHRMLLRNYIGHKGDFVQLSYFSNSNNAVNMNPISIIDNLKIYQIGLNKEIVSRLALQFHLSYSSQLSKELRASKLRYALSITKRF